MICESKIQVFELFEPSIQVHEDFPSQFDLGKPRKQDKSVESSKTTHPTNLQDPGDCIREVLIKCYKCLALPTPTQAVEDTVEAA